MNHDKSSVGGPPRWMLAVVGAAMLAAAAGWWSLNRPDDNMPGENAGPAAHAVSRPADPVQEYIDFAAVNRDGQVPQAAWNADVVVQGLRTLAGALGTLAIGGPDLQVDLRVSAEHLLLNPGAAASTTGVRDSLERAAKAIDGAQPDVPPSLTALAEAIDPARPLIDQEKAIRTFFGAAAAAIMRANAAAAL